MIDTIYVMDNPFPNFHVYCVAEVKVDGQWGETGWLTNYASTWQATGTKASQVESSIVVQTGATQVFIGGQFTGSGIQNTVNLTSAPCRVKVWKVGKIS